MMSRSTAASAKKRQWLTPAEIGQEFGFKDYLPKLWAKHGCPALPGGRNLRRKPLPGGQPGHDFLYRRADLERAAAVPELPESGRWEERGRQYVTSEVARLEYGLACPRLASRRDKAGKKPHAGRRLKQDATPDPALSRKIHSRERLFWTRRGHIRSLRWVYLYDEGDLKEICRRHSASAAADSEWPTAEEVSLEFRVNGKTARRWAALGLVRSRKELRRYVVRQKTPSGRRTVHVSTRGVLTICRDDLESLRDREDGLISLPQAEKDSGIAYGTWYQWGGKPICPPLGKRLELIPRMTLTAAGRRRKILHIRRRDYKSIVEKKQLRDADQLAQVSDSVPAPGGNGASQVPGVNQRGGVSPYSHHGPPLDFVVTVNKFTPSAMEQLDQHRAGRRDDHASDVERMRRAIAEVPEGKSAKASVLIAAAGIAEKRGRDALRDLEDLGEYHPTRKRPARYAR